MGQCLDIDRNTTNCYWTCFDEIRGMKGKITTKQGDGGTTSIVGGERVAKDDPRIECLGELDEANSALGLLRSKLEADHQWETGLLVAIYAKKNVLGTNKKYQLVEIQI